MAISETINQLFVTGDYILKAADSDSYWSSNFNTTSFHREQKIGFTNERKTPTSSYNYFRNGFNK